ncbi:hypothetical protein [Pantoea agglomerans]|uniref:hypothetical protein n=1 Tax=Enterobacter agglomerans TaxID=549 RepID=UPI001F4FA310|nr:hypothetical protein [Pantoea agglomerans]WVL82583.1 hypothetical protein IFT78_022295 [Pantoea agglomerans]
MKLNNSKWKCNYCDNNCGEATNTFGSLLCMYAFLTQQPGSDTEMWFKEHSPHHRELISTNGEVIAIWRSKQNVWQERTGKDNVEDMFVYGYETGEEFIGDEGDAFNLALIIL